MDLTSRVSSGQGGFVLFAVTPPRRSTPAERLPEIARATVERLDHLDLDGLILYDIDDESSRNPAERPFPFSPTVDPAEYRAEHLAAWRTPVVVYRAVGKYQREGLRTWLADQDPGSTLTVMVGAASSGTSAPVSLTEAQALRAEANPELLLGGVAIPERHSRRENEHLRLIAKQEAGCRFFVTQVVYDLNAAKNLVSDYRYECEARGLDPVPIVFTFSVCGSMKTLEFLRWLGVDVPRWIENDLRHATNPLRASLEQAVVTAVELIDFCRRLGVPFGINVESVSIRREEIEASVELAEQLTARLRG
ncbi:methylenetetrahydrofolate reductase [Nocardioides sp. YIM 152588]|uniref:methylenetetrahydrofolate reductase n=1 Tax=Nocardioides sp. YIM 152588 TaxID=3158259 RepID=UPI0032E40DB6